MSYEKHVYPKRLPPDLFSTVKEVLPAHGLEVEFPAGLALHTHRGGYLPCKTTILPGAFPGAERYGHEPLLAGFEFHATLDAEERLSILDEYEEDCAAESSPLPQQLMAKLRAAPAILSFTHGGFSWNAADFRLCWFVTAAVAVLTEGLLFDEWGGDEYGYRNFQQAFLVANERCLQLDNDDNLEDRWNIPPFVGWEAVR